MWTDEVEILKADVGLGHQERGEDFYWAFAMVPSVRFGCCLKARFHYERGTEHSLLLY